ncbi:MAG TPA: glycoside hydrolase family 88 protein, partial [Puia sp.]
MSIMKFYFSALAGGMLLLHTGVRAQGSEAGKAGPESVRMANTVMHVWKDGDDSKAPRWTYDEGVVWKGLESCWYNTGDARYYKYIQHLMDRLVDKEGNILTYKKEDYNLDNILCGRLLLLLYRVSNQEKYHKAASLLRRQLEEQPRTAEGSFWHKKKYTQQVWLDGLYMAQPFYAEWAATFHEDSAFNDIARQLALIERHTRDSKTGLLYHGWDASKQERWADKATGHSPNFWARAMGWYGMALVDVLDYFPKDHPGHKQILAILNRYAAAVSKVQDPATGLWWDVLDKGGAKGNYLEASASCMFVYTLEKGVRMGWLPASYRAVASKGYAGVLKKFVRDGAGG